MNPESTFEQITLERVLYKYECIFANKAGLWHSEKQSHSVIMK